MNLENTIAIVGNGKLHDDDAKKIDSSRLVFRFNFPKYNIDEGGEKTDYLFIVNSGGIALNWIKSSDFLTSPYFDLCKQVVLPWNPEIIRTIHPRRTLNDVIHKRKKDITNEIKEILSLKNKNFFGLSYELNALCYRELMKYEKKSKLTKQKFVPSTGFLGIIYALTLLDEINFESIILYGFSHQGWKGHKWGKEKNYLKNHRLIKYSDKLNM